jgi:hypothetical protein
VADTKTTLEFVVLAVAMVHGISQNVVEAKTGVSAPHGPDDVLPR